MLITNFRVVLLELIILPEINGERLVLRFRNCALPDSVLQRNPLHLAVMYNCFYLHKNHTFKEVSHEKIQRITTQHSKRPVAVQLQITPFIFPIVMSTATLRRKIDGAGDLRSVVRTMKALAASNIGQYEQSVRSLADYFSSVEAGLGVCFRQLGPTVQRTESKRRDRSLELSAVVFGSDRGLVGGFNDVIADYAIKTLADIPGTHRIWAVGERVHAHLEDAGLPLSGLFAVPNSVRSITPLIAQILVARESQHTSSSIMKIK